ncbi:hypothetical protein D3C75_886800 [compost metagenome]
MLFIRNLYRRTLPDLKADNGRLHVRLWNEYRTRYDTDQFRLTVVLHGDAQTAIFLAARGSCHSFSNLLLDHYNDVIQGQLLFQQLHEYGCGHIIRQIGHYTDSLHCGKLLSKQFPQVHLQHIIVTDVHMRIRGQNIPQNRNQPPVDLHCRYSSGCGGQPFGQSADARSNLQCTGSLIQARSVHNLVQNILVNQKILTQAFLE